MNEINDEEVLNFLMTSDFNEEYSPEELKYLLHKWRYFYRLMKGKNDQLAQVVSSLENEVEIVKNDCINKIDENKKELERLQHTIFNLKNRKLTLKERMSGKIVIDNNENK